MSRPGFVYSVDERTPPLVVSNGEGFRLEHLPLGTKVVYPVESTSGLADVAGAIGAALDAPVDSEPLAARLRPGMRLTIAFDDNTRPVPPMRRPDIRGRIIEAVLTRAAAAGVDDVALVCANGLNRRLTATELHRLLGERVYRSFFADGRLTNHDAEDADNLTPIGSSDAGEVALNERAAQADLLVFVHVAVTPRGGGNAQVLSALGSTGTINSVMGGSVGGPVAEDRTGTAETVAAQVGAAVPIFSVEAVLDNDVFSGAADFLGRREWEWGVKDRAAWFAMHHGLGLTPVRTRRRLVNAAEGGFSPLALHAGSPEAVAKASREEVLAAQVVEVSGQADVGVIGVPATCPYSVDSITNPVLAAWSGLAAVFASHTGTPVVRPGGALIVFHPLPADFSPLHHPSYVDFFAEVLAATTDPERIRTDFEQRFVADPWYVHLYRSSYAFHGLHPLLLWYQVAAAAAHCADIVWVGADRGSAERMGFRAASTLADALEIVASSVGRSPSITYLHSPPQLVADVR
jgi:hypothetical protein